MLAAFHRTWTTGYTGSLSLIKPLRPQRGIEPALRYGTEPGTQAQCDWADFGAPLYIFIYTMSFSAACMWNLCTTNAKRPYLIIHPQISQVVGQSLHRITKSK